MSSNLFGPKLRYPNKKRDAVKTCKTWCIWIGIFCFCFPAKNRNEQVISILKISQSSVHKLEGTLWLRNGKNIPTWLETSLELMVSPGRELEKKTIFRGAKKPAEIRRVETLRFKLCFPRCTQNCWEVILFPELPRNKYIFNKQSLESPKHHVEVYQLNAWKVWKWYVSPAKDFAEIQPTFRKYFSETNIHNSFSGLLACSNRRVRIPYRHLMLSDANWAIFHPVPWSVESGEQLFYESWSKPWVGERGRNPVFGNYRDWRRLIYQDWQVKRKIIIMKKRCTGQIIIKLNWILLCHERCSGQWRLFGLVLRELSCYQFQLGELVSSTFAVEFAFDDTPPMPWGLAQRC